MNEPITVRVTPKSIEITSFPGFDRSISNEAIKNYDIRARIYRNRRIGDFLKELKLIEGRNTGFPNAFKALEENGSAYPRFEMNENRDYLSVVLPIHSYFLPKEAEKGKDVVYREKIIKTLRAKPMSLNELAKALGYKSISKKLSDTINAMLQEGVLERVISEKGYSVIALA